MALSQDRGHSMRNPSEWGLGTAGAALTQSAIASLAALLICSPSEAEQSAPDAGRVDYSRSEYVSNCAGCHGPSGQGDGHFRDYLTRVPPDLTVLSRNNGGVFPYQRLYEVIDGRAALAAHGGRDMPIWGADYRAQAVTMAAPPYSGRPEHYVRYRIGLLLDYLHRIQKP